MTSPESQAAITPAEIVALLTEHGVTVPEGISDDQLADLLDSTLTDWKAKADANTTA